jgi:CheY-like chemotaxis protein
VLLDYSLPDFNGDEVCRRLLANELTARTPVVHALGHVPEMSAAASRYPNIVATLAKPFLSTALIDLVAATLEHPPEVRVAAPQQTGGGRAPPRAIEPFPGDVAKPVRLQPQ